MLNKFNKFSGNLSHLIEAAILFSRWILVAFYAGLATALAVYAVYFTQRLWVFASHIFSKDSNETILGILGLIDAALIASVVIMVIVSSYENFVNHFSTNKDAVRRMRMMDAGSLKVKIAATIIAISSIHLLQIFLNIDKNLSPLGDSSVNSNKVFWYIVLHLTFIASGFFLSLMDWVSHIVEKKYAEDDYGIDL